MRHCCATTSDTVFDWGVYWCDISTCREVALKRSQSALKSLSITQLNLQNFHFYKRKSCQDEDFLILGFIVSQGNVLSYSQGCYIPNNAPAQRDGAFLFLVGDEFPIYSIQSAANRESQRANIHNHFVWSFLLASQTQTITKPILFNHFFIFINMYPQKKKMF